MPVSSLDLLDLAEGLAENFESEAAFRASVSRAYYASFYAAEDAAKRIKMPKLSRRINGGMHERLFCRFDDAGQRALAAKLRFAKADRVNADYKIDEVFTKNEATAALAFCRQLSGDIAALS